MRAVKRVLVLVPVVVLVVGCGDDKTVVPKVDPNSKPPKLNPAASGGADKKAGPTGSAN